MAKILIVDDDPDLVGKLRDWLVSENHHVESVDLGKDALQLLSSFQFDVVVLDWNLPDTTGLDVLKNYRGTGGKVPIIFLTGRGEMENKLTGLESGADDYMIKPFDARELSARIKTLLRRPSSLLSTQLTARGAVLEVENKTLIAGENRIVLRARECALLEFLMRNRNRTFSAKALLDSVWPSDADASEDSVRTCMKTLRHKLSSIEKDDLIKTVLGSGYIIEGDE